MFSIQNSSRKWLLLLPIIALLLSLFLGNLPTQAAVFYPTEGDGNLVEVKSTRENVYASGNEVRVNEAVAKDVVAAGSQVKVRANVGRSIMAAGEEVTIDSNRVGGAVRTAARKVVVRGNFGEEVVAAGEEVVIEDSVINGDLIVATNRLVVKNSQILGNAKVAYSTLEGNLEDQVRGKIEKAEGRKESREGFLGASILLFLTVQFSVIVFILVVGYLLSRKKYLRISEIAFNGKFGMDVLTSLGFLILAVPVLILSFILQLYPLVSLLVALVYLSFILSSFFFPIYLANLAKSTFKTKLSMPALVVISYLVVAILSVIPFVNILSFLVFFVFQLGNYGFLVRKLSTTVWNSIDSKNETVEEEKSEPKKAKVKKEDEKE